LFICSFIVFFISLRLDFFYFTYEFYY